jgi:two-component system LytT family sensor kinase
MQPASRYHRNLSLQVFGATAVLNFLITYNAGFSFYTSLWGSLTTATILSACVLISFFSVCKYPTKAWLVFYGMMIGIAPAAMGWYVDLSIAQWVYSNSPKYMAWLENLKWQRLLFYAITGAWMSTLAAQKRKMAVLEQQFKELTDAATLHREAELFKLRQQLQPHFLYNSLNSISALVMIEPDQAQEMIGRLSDFLRNSVKREGKEAIPVAEELEYIEAYLGIEAVRFGDRLQIIYDRQFTDHATIPPFLMQPILENAIKFGLYGNTGSVEIHMHIQLQDDNLRIRITNPYAENEKPPSGTGFGLHGIRRRLYLLYGRTDLLETAQEGGVFITTLTIPQRDGGVPLE